MRKALIGCVINALGLTIHYVLAATVWHHTDIGVVIATAGLIITFITLIQNERKALPPPPQ